MAFKQSSLKPHSDLQWVKSCWAKQAEHLESLKPAKSQKSIIKTWNLAGSLRLGSICSQVTTSYGRGQRVAGGRRLMEPKSSCIVVLSDLWRCSVHWYVSYNAILKWSDFLHFWGKHWHVRLIHLNSFIRNWGFVCPISFSIRCRWSIRDSNYSKLSYLIIRSVCTSWRCLFVPSRHH